jgi:predicted nuclease of restriction endonuclease-like (RecB) superfamily
MKLTRTFIEDVRRLILSARTAIARGADLVQVYTNFEIGRRIVAQEQKGKARAEYGEAVLQALSARLSAEFGRGFARSSLEYMRKFFLLYQDRAGISQSVIGKLAPAQKLQSLIGNSQIPQSLIAEPFGTPISQSPSGESRSTLPSSEAQLRPFSLSWTHYVFLVGIKNPGERSFYEIEAAAQGWTVRELKRQFDTSLYERLALSRDKKGVRRLAKEGQVVTQPADLLKEPLVLEFLGLEESPRYSETDLETAIINRLEQFLLELGRGFLFEARQRRFTFDGDHYYVDLVFYNRLLRCYVLVDLKLGKLTHQDLGQMQMYVNYFDRYVIAPVENPTIGIVLCKKKNQALVEITLPKGANIHAREYQLYLPSKKQLRQKLLEWAGKAGAE